MNDTPAVSRHLNILGCLSILVSVVFFVIFFKIADVHNAVYYIGGGYTFLIISILAFGFSKIMEMLDKLSK